ncbi:MAG TPA: hypothetical protein VNW68_04090, partial [Candidatus Limnocylindria bacterium]|nr:hypothetical protein [Candidatus Limnocylindria bacterium]
MSGLRQVIGRRQVTARRLAGAWLATVLVASMAGALPAQAAEPVIEDVEARTVLGQPVVFTASVSAGWEPVDAELLLSFAGDDSTYIIGADLAPRPGGGWTATARSGCQI